MLTVTKTATVTRDSGSGVSSYTFSNVSIGTAFTGRLVVIVLTSVSAVVAKKVTGITFRGNPMTLNVEESEGNQGEVTIASIVQNTETSGDFVITWDGESAIRIKMDVFVLSGYKNATPYSIDSNGSGLSIVNSLSVTLNIPAGGVALLGLSRSGDNTNKASSATSWTNATLVQSNTFDSNRHRLESAKNESITEQTGLSVSASWTTLVRSGIAGAVWEPEEPPVSRPTLTTQSASSITHNSATANGNITNTGGEDATKRGFVYDTVSRADPGNTAPASTAYANFVEESGTYGTGAFSLTLSNLITDTTYYVRSFAQNSAGYAYGSEQTFKTFLQEQKSMTATAQASSTFGRGVKVIKSVTAQASASFLNTKQILKTLSVVGEATASMLKTVGKKITATVQASTSIQAGLLYVKEILTIAQASATMTRIRVKLMTMSVTAEATATISKIKQYARNLVANAEATTSLAKQISLLREMVATAQVSASQIANQTKLLVLTTTAQVNVSIEKTKNLLKEFVITAKATTSMVVGRLLQKALTATAQASAVFNQTKAFLRDMTATAQVSATVIRLKTFSQFMVVTAQASTLVIQSGLILARTLVVTASATVTNTMQKALSKTLIATGRAIVSVLRDYGYIDKYPRNQVNYEDKYPE